MYYKPFDEHVSEMKKFGVILMPYSFPMVSADEEDIVNNIKSREIYVDGYNLIIHYNKACYDDYYLDTVQVVGKYSPFLPLSLVCKIGKRFLGDQCLSLVELFKDGRKIYCWTLVLNKQLEPVVGPYQNIEHCFYEGLEYRCVDPKQVNFF